MWFSSHWTEQNQEKILQALPRNTTRYLTIVVFKRGHLNLCDASIFTVEHDELDDRESMLVYLWTLISHRAIVCTPSKENWTHVKICHLETFRGINLIYTKLYDLQEHGNILCQTYIDWGCLSLPFVLWSVFTCMPVSFKHSLIIISREGLISTLWALIFLQGRIVDSNNSTKTCQTLGSQDFPRPSRKPPFVMPLPELRIFTKTNDSRPQSHQHHQTTRAMSMLWFFRSARTS